MKGSKKSLKYRTKKLKNPNFLWEIWITEPSNQYLGSYSYTNGTKILPIRLFCQNMEGKYRISYYENYRKERYYNKLLLSNDEDLFLFILAFQESIFRIYKLEKIDSDDKKEGQD